MRIQEQAGTLYRQPDAWARRAIVNVGHSGKFSSDRTIMEYAREHLGCRGVSGGPTMIPWVNDTGRNQTKAARGTELGRSGMPAVARNGSPGSWGSPRALQRRTKQRGPNV